MSSTTSENAVKVFDQPISRDSALSFVDYLRRGAKLEAERMCGVEVELFGYTADRLARLDGEQVQSVLTSFASSDDDLRFEEASLVEAVMEQNGRVSVEPGGQIEFSNKPRHNLAEAERDVESYLALLRETAEEHGFLFLATGFDPLCTIEEQQWFPKKRYRVMRPFLAKRGPLAWDMMSRTCAVQVNLDYTSEADLAKKFVLGNHLAPIITAIFACSPFKDGELSGYKSTRAAVWLNTDPDRAGPAPFASPEKFTFDSFVAYALDVPMIFARRDGCYLEVPVGTKFKSFLDGMSDIQPVFEDWIDHLTVIFTDARLKQYIELRSADCGSPRMWLAAQALWKGLMYDAATLDEALRLAPELDSRQAAELRACVAREGLAARFAGVDVLGLAKELIKLAALGLQRIAPDEGKYLDILREQVVEDEVCPADVLLRNWHGSWHGRMDHVIQYLRVA
ncbi:MAG: glutamate--cysteine ligase [Pyrinomonadaceae bacterium]|nr:glutamate--cysteine ligase [Pyrinomonadaceae bacterium]